MSSLQSSNNLQSLQDFCDTHHATLVMFTSESSEICKKLIPLIQKVARKYPDEEIGFLGVEMNDLSRDIINFYWVSPPPPATFILFNRIDRIAYLSYPNPALESEEDLIDWLSERIK